MVDPYVAGSGSSPDGAGRARPGGGPRISSSAIAVRGSSAKSFLSWDTKDDLAAIYPSASGWLGTSGSAKPSRILVSAMTFFIR